MIKNQIFFPNIRPILLFLLFFIVFFFPKLAIANIHCSIDFELKSWSVIYKQTKGTGTIKCNNGETIPVKIKAHGGGLTVGESKIKGHGTFTGVDKIDDLFGTYADAEAHGGIHDSGVAQVLTKDGISLSYTATGKGYNVGVALGGFTIKKQ